MLRNHAIAVLSLSMLASCNALDKPGVNGNTKFIVPEDTRPATEALRALPAISGGTLAVSEDGAYAVAADPDRDRISIVPLMNEAARVAIELERGDEPGRVVIDGALHAYVALRGAGDVVRIDLASGELVDRTHVCSAPRGLAFDAASTRLHVACADGRLVSLDGKSGAIARTLDLGTDLRDVIVHGDQLVVSTFKAAELITIDAAGSVSARTRPPAFQLAVPRPSKNPNQPDLIVMQSMQAQLAWRMVQNPIDPRMTMMLHQGESSDAVDVSVRADDPERGANSAYGGGANAQCAGIVNPSVTVIGAQGAGQTVALSGVTLGVDMAISPADGSLAIAEAGNADQSAPKPFVVRDDSGDGVVGLSSSSGGGPISRAFPTIGQGPGLVVRLAPPPSTMMLANDPGVPPQAACVAVQMIAAPGQVTAVAFTRAGTLVAQTREPAAVMLVPPATLTAPFGAPLPTAHVIDLGGDSVLDTGHELFHRDSGGGIACASCHGEGAEDGHTWVFSDTGPRRTQALHVGLQGTAPFHWNGDLPNVGTLMERIFVGRMGGVHQSGERTDALTHFLFGLKPPAPIVAAGDEAALRGKALFESADVGCSDCHQGAKFTNNESYDVGTSQGERLQVPSLRGVGYRAPFIHTGCAATLRARFDPSCGGASHGRTAQLDDAQIDDLIAYLRSI